MSLIRHPRAAAALAALVLALAPVPATAVAQEGGAAEEQAAPKPSRRAARVDPEDVRPFFERHLPQPLRAPGPRGLLWWQWLALPALLVLAIVVGSLLGWGTRRVLGHLASRTRTAWDDVLIDRIGSPLTALWAIAIVTLLQPWLVLDDDAARVLQRTLRAAAYLSLFWAGLRSVNVAFSVMGEAPWTRTNASLAGLLPLGRKIAKVLLLALGVVAVLNELGFHVASLLAGLGIGGIAIALAAQKTVENLFGSVAIGVDQPFRVGDFVRIDDATMGNVEVIGMRSTRIRTLDRTIVTIPNGKLADMKSETFAARDRIRLFVNLGLVYSTTSDQMRRVVAELRETLLAHPKIFPEGVGVRFTAFADSALNVEVVAMFQTADWNEFSEIRQELFLEFLRIVERAGTSFAFPTRTVQVVGAQPTK